MTFGSRTSLMSQSPVLSVIVIINFKSINHVDEYEESEAVSKSGIQFRKDLHTDPIRICKVPFLNLLKVCPTSEEFG